ncbi:non-heme iron oxygenase ferredoxin subunit [Zhihengliuella alba]|uniref:Non-heme iron oxygenase ferredoxin subunit n=1 Tax=Zhihengliuella alba TaxID=547018 RepID=A0ABP7DGI8_9MICC
MSDAINLGPAAEIEEGEARVVPSEEIGTDDDVTIFHAEDGSFYALDDTCTHETASLADGWIEGTEIECPLHSARFCLKTGEATCMPATVGVRPHKVEVVDGDLVLYPNQAP